MVLVVGGSVVVAWSSLKASDKHCFSFPAAITFSSRNEFLPELTVRFTS